ncbi:YonK family protein [Metabacillus fastidiosus]|uniref:YonK family protein n=1 Tax=Metabacillus fastidiosus TaxID=1458 RepID=UPI003D2ABDA8
MSKKIGKNEDAKQVKREGSLDVNTMKIEYYDEKSESKYVYDLSEPFKEYDGENIEVSITIKKVAKAEKEITVDGEIIE